MAKINLVYPGVRLISLLVMMSLSLVSCKKNQDSLNDMSLGQAEDSGYLDSTGISDAVNFYGESITPEEEAMLLNQRTVYFGFDRYDLTLENKKILLAHAKKLLDNPNLSVRISGHTDARGSREYNVALGEHRAKTVARLMAMKGISDNRIIVVSYGKEQPVAFGNDENSWAMNRRVEIEYQG